MEFKTAIIHVMIDGIPVGIPIMLGAMVIDPYIAGEKIVKHMCPHAQYVYTEVVNA